MRHFLLLAVGNHVVPAQQLAASASIHVDEDLSRDLRRQAENFVYTAARAYKEGMKRFGKAMGKDISFMFQKQPAYERALIVLRSTDPGLADYLRETRTLWSERLIEKRNDIDHNGWSLPPHRISFEQWAGGSETAAHRWPNDGRVYRIHV